MADILLQKPQAGQVVALTPQPEDRLVFEFEPGDALLERAGDNLTLSFNDGSSIELTDFYVAYTSENMPEFVIGEAVVPGEAFFAALSEDLMPAAGPGAGTALGSGNSVGFEQGSLLGGLTREVRLDQAFGDDGVTFDDAPAAAPVAADGGAPVAAATTGGDAPVATPVNQQPVIDSITFTDPPLHLDDDGVVGVTGGYVIEAGVGRDATGMDVSAGADPNHAYAGKFVTVGQINATDPEGDPLTYGVVNPTGQFGSVAVNASNGSFVYTMYDENDPLYSDLIGKLNHGEVLTETFIFTVTDNINLPRNEQATITIVGTNDQPDLSIALVDGIVTEDDNDASTPADNTANGTLSVVDVDADGDTLAEQTITIEVDIDGKVSNYTVDTQAGAADKVIVGKYGNLEVSPTGTWVYTAGVTEDQQKALDVLGGDIKPSDMESFKVTTTDAHNAFDTETINITVNGVDDAHVVTVTKDLNIIEEGIGRNNLGVDITNDANKSDDMDAYAGITSASGNIKVTDVDSTVSTITLKDGIVDSTNNNIFTITDTNGYGTFTYNQATGAYSYQLNAAANELSHDYNQDFTFTFEYTVGGVDKSETVTVNVKGTNDAPDLTIKVDDSNDLIVTEDSLDLTVIGSLEVKDPDIDGDTLAEQTITIEVDIDGKVSNYTVDTQAGAADKVIVGKYGNLEVSPTGKWEYTAGVTADQQKALDKLNATDTKTESFKVTTTDAHNAFDTEDINITVKGANDDPVIGEITNAKVFEKHLYDGTEKDADGVSTDATGTIKATDVDNNSDVSFEWDIQGDVNNYTNQPNLWTSEGVKIEWKYGEKVENGVTLEDRTILIGTAGGKDIITVKTTEGADGEFSYTVELKESVMHDAPEATLDKDYNTDTDANGVADKKDNDATNESGNLEFGFIVKDGVGGSDTDKVIVTIEDDIITLSSTATEYATKYVADSYLHGSIEFEENAKDFGFTGATFSAAKAVFGADGSVTITPDSGGKVAWGGKPESTYKIEGKDVTFAEGYGLNVTGVLDDDNDEREMSHVEGQAEALIIDLPDGQTAYGFSAEFELWFSADKEVKGAEEAYIALYKEVPAGTAGAIEMEAGKWFVQVYSPQTTASEFDGGAGQASIGGFTDGFDRIVFAPATSVSDFVVSGLNFTLPSEHVIASVEGDVDWNGADGMQSLTIDGVSGAFGDTNTETVNVVKNGITYTEKSTVTLGSGATEETYTVYRNADGNVIRGENAAGETVFEMVLNNQTGGWELFQYKSMENDLELTFEVVDKDGDAGTLTVTVDTFDASAGGGNVLLDEDDLVTNTATFEWTPTNGLTVPADLEGEFYAQDGVTVLGTYKANGGNIDFTLTNNASHASGANENNYDAKDVVVQLFDAQGRPVDVTIAVDITDDVPVLTSSKATDTDSDGVVDTTEATISNGIASADFQLEFGADKIGSVLSISNGGTNLIHVQFNGTAWQEVVLNSSGEWEVKDTAHIAEGTYDTTTGVHSVKLGDVTLTNASGDANWNVSYDVSGRENVTISFTDGDGDKVEHTFEANPTINVDLDTSDTTVEVDESKVAWGTQNGSGNVSDTNTIVVTAQAGLKAIKFGDEVLATLQGDGTWKFNDALDAGDTSIKINGVVQNGDQFSVSYTSTVLDGVLHNDDNTVQDTVNPDVVLTFVDVHDNTVNTTLDVTILDDAPIATGNTTIVPLTPESETAQGIVTLNFGADLEDGATIELNGVIATWNGTEWTGASANVDNGTTTLTFGEITLKNSGNTDWVVTLPKAMDGSDQKIIITDADNDSANVFVKADWSYTPPIINNLEGLVGTTGPLKAGLDYNVSVLLDTSGSTAEGYKGKGWDSPTGDLNHDVQNALEKFLGETLFQHANDAIGGTINLQIVTFSSRAISHEYVLDDGKIYEADDLVNAIYDGDDLAAAANAIVATLTSPNGDKDQGVGDYNLPGTSETGDDQEIWVGGATNYEKALIEANKWLENQPDVNGGNKLIFATDGEPTEGNLDKPPTRTFTFDDIAGDAYADIHSEIWSGERDQDIKFDVSGKVLGETWTAKGEYIVYRTVLGVYDRGTTSTEYQLSITDNNNDGVWEFNVQAIIKNPDGTTSLGAMSTKTYTPVLLEELDANLGVNGEFIAAGFADPNSNAGKNLLQDLNDVFLGIADVITVTNDANSLFDPSTGSITGTATGTNLAYTGEGDDIVIGGMNVAQIMAAVTDKINIDGYTASNFEAMKYLANNPEWFASVETDTVQGNPNEHVDAHDADIIIAGAGHDTAYGQGGEDLLIGDSDLDKLDTFAEQLGLQDYVTKMTNLTDGNGNDSTADEARDMAQSLVDKAQAADSATLVAAASAMEDNNADGTTNDGDDTLYGGDSDDVLLGLGGHDELHGGDGNDILLGGSGDDLLYGGDGDDTLYGGAGDDLIIGLDIDDILIDGGDDMDVLLAGTTKLQDVRDKLSSGEIENTEIIVTGKELTGQTVDAVLAELGLTTTTDATTNEEKIVIDEKVWGTGTKDATTGYTEYTNAKDTELTILVETTKIEQGNT